MGCPMIEELTTKELDHLRRLSHRGPASPVTLDDRVCERLRARRFTDVGPDGWRLTTGGWLAYRAATVRGLI